MEDTKIGGIADRLHSNVGSRACLREKSSVIKAILHQAIGAEGQKKKVLIATLLCVEHDVAFTEKIGADVVQIM